MKQDSKTPNKRKVRKPTYIEISLVWLISLAIMFIVALNLGGQLQRNSDAHIQSVRAEAVSEYKAELKETK